MLTLPLTDADQRGGRTPWPTLPVELKAVSLLLHSPPEPTGQCTLLHTVVSYLLCRLPDDRWSMRETPTVL